MQAHSQSETRLPLSKRLIADFMTGMAPEAGGGYRWLLQTVPNAQIQAVDQWLLKTLMRFLILRDISEDLSELLPSNLERPLGATVSVVTALQS